MWGWRRNWGSVNIQVAGAQFGKGKCASGAEECGVEGRGDVVDLLKLGAPGGAPCSANDLHNPGFPVGDEGRAGLGQRGNDALRVEREEGGRGGRRKYAMKNTAHSSPLGIGVPLRAG